MGSQSGRNTTATNLRSIKKKKIQKAIRKIMFKIFNHSTETPFNEVKILNLEQQKNLAVAGFRWKVKNDMIPKILQSNRNRVYAQNNQKYIIPIANTDFLKQGITYQGPRVWNYLKSELKNKETLL